jgi:hypothetical protein
MINVMHLRKIIMEKFIIIYKYIKDEKFIINIANLIKSHKIKF